MDKQTIERAVEAAAKAEYEATYDDWSSAGGSVRAAWCDGMRTSVTAALAEAEESLTAERDRLKRGGHTLGKIIDRWGEAIIAATDSESLVDEDRDGDWQVIEERLAGLRPRIDKAEAERDYYRRILDNHGKCICDTGPGTGGPDEFCPWHGRSYTEILEWANTLAARVARVEALAADWHSRGERDMELSKELPDDVGDALYIHGVGMVDSARLVREAIRGESE